MGDEVPARPANAKVDGQLPEAKIDAPGGFKITVPLPPWAVGLLAIVFIAGLVLAGAYWGFSKVSGRVLVPTEDLNDYKETAKHDIDPDTTKEKREITFDDGVKVTLKHFHTDGCVEVLRTSQALITDKHWLLDLSRVAPPPTHSAAYGISVTEPIQLASLMPRTKLFKIMRDQQRSPHLGFDEPLPLPLTSIPAQAPPGCNRGCLNPHPGNFQSWVGSVNGCWQQVWRRWPEGCTHFQWYNTCYNVWDTNPDGSPRITWTCCVH